MITFVEAIVMVTILLKSIQTVSSCNGVMKKFSQKLHPVMNFLKQEGKQHRIDSGSPWNWTDSLAPPPSRPYVPLLTPLSSSSERTMTNLFYLNDAVSCSMWIDLWTKSMLKFGLILQLSKILLLLISNPSKYCCNFSKKVRIEILAGSELEKTRVPK